MTGEECDKELLQKTIDSCNKHDEVIICAHCGSPYLTVRAGLTYHNHPPLGECIEEIFECDECNEYSQVVWTLDSIRKLGRIIV